MKEFGAAAGSSSSLGGGNHNNDGNPDHGGQVMTFHDDTTHNNDTEANDIVETRRNNKAEKVPSSSRAVDNTAPVPPPVDAKEKGNKWEMLPELATATSPGRHERDNEKEDDDDEDDDEDGGQEESDGKGFRQLRPEAPTPTPAAAAAPPRGNRSEKPPPPPLPQHHQLMRAAATGERASLFNSNCDMALPALNDDDNNDNDHNDDDNDNDEEEEEEYMDGSVRNSASLLLRAKRAQEPATFAEPLPTTRHYGKHDPLKTHGSEDEFFTESPEDEQNKKQQHPLGRARRVRRHKMWTPAALVLLLLIVLILVVFLFLPERNNAESNRPIDDNTNGNNNDNNNNGSDAKTASPSLEPTTNPDSIRVDDDDETTAPGEKETIPIDESIVPPTVAPSLSASLLTPQKCTPCADPDEQMPLLDKVLYFDFATGNNVTCADFAEQVQTNAMATPEDIQICQVQQSTAALNCGCTPSRSNSTLCFFCDLTRPTTNDELAQQLEETASPPPSPLSFSGPSSDFPTILVGEDPNNPFDLSFSLNFLVPSGEPTTTTPPTPVPDFNKIPPTMTETPTPTTTTTTSPCPLCFDGSTVPTAAESATALTTETSSFTCGEVQTILQEKSLSSQACFDFQMIGLARCNCDGDDDDANRRHPDANCWLCPSGGLPPNLDLVIATDLNNGGQPITCFDALLAAAVVDGDKDCNDLFALQAVACQCAAT